MDDEAYLTWGRGKAPVVFATRRLICLLCELAELLTDAHLWVMHDSLPGAKSSRTAVQPSEGLGKLDSCAMV